MRKTVLWIVGDSTASSFEDKIYIPRYGWGAVINEYLNDSIEVKNLAISGTSSKSFRTTENYSSVLEGMSEGDYLLIGFGHNDQKSGAVTFTDARGDYKTPGSFAHSLYTYYIKPALEKGTTPILICPIPRRDTKMKYEGEFVHDTIHGNYAQAIRDLGKATNTMVCDLTRGITELIRSTDSDDIEDNDSLYQHARTGTNPACTDDTHTSLFGAMIRAYQIVLDMARMDSRINTYLKKEINNPLDNASYWKDKSIDHSYKDPEYVQPANLQGFWPKYIDKTGTTWYASVFGDIFGGGPKSTESFYFGTDANGDMVIKAGITGNNGKIAPTSDGIAMYFVRIPNKTGFKLKARVRLDSFNAAGQAAEYAAYGLMVRDDMYIDEINGNLMGDYVVGGILFRSETPNGSNTFARRNYVNVFEGGSLASTPTPGESMDMMVASTRDGYMAQVGDNDPVIAGYDFSLTRVDNEYVYLGFFAARSISITVTDIELTIV